LVRIEGWKDSRHLFEHALAVTERNAFAHSNLGAVRFSDGEVAAAKREFRAAIAIDPSLPEGHHNLGFALQALGELRGSRGATVRARVCPIYC
jgi:Tfp pilus assembly protein PilF